MLKPTFIHLYIFITILMLLPSFASAATALTFTVNMSEPVNITGTPQLILDIGGVTHTANYISGSGTAALTFTYNTVAGDVDLDGITLTSPLSLNSGTVSDAAGNPASLNFTLPNTTGIKVSYPSLSMDFINNDYIFNSTHYASLTSLLSITSGTFTRTTTGTYFNSGGVMQTAAVNVPRIEPSGLLIEESRTNYLLQSNAFTTAPWDTSTCGGGVTNSGSTTIAPDGASVPIYNFSTTACLFQDIAVTIGKSITHSVWIKANKSGVIGFRTPGTTAVTSQNITVGTTWQRYTLNATASAASSRFLIDNRTANGYGVTGLQLSLFGGQLEVGDFATSYIPTTTTAVARAADNLTFSGLSAAIGSSVTAEADIVGMPSGNYWGVLNIDNGSLADSLFLCRNSSTAEWRINSRISGTSWGGDTNIGTMPSSPTITKAAMAYNGTTLKSVVDNGSITTQTPGSAGPTSFSRITIGNEITSGGKYANTNIRKIVIWPTFASDAQLKLMTQ